MLNTNLYNITRRTIPYLPSLQHNKTKRSLFTISPSKQDETLHYLQSFQHIKTNRSLLTIFPSKQDEPFLIYHLSKITRGTFPYLPSFQHNKTKRSLFTIFPTYNVTRRTVPLFTIFRR